MNKFEHSMNINTSTNFVINAIQYCCDNKKCILHELLEYVFYDICKSKRDELYKLLKNAVVKQKTDLDVFFIIYNWNHSVVQNERLDNPIIRVNGKVISYSDYKVYEITNTIKTVIPKNTLLVDIGAGDCALTKNVADKLGIAGVAIDIKQPIDWTSLATEQNKCLQLNETKNQNGIVGKHIYYHGNDLIDSVKKHYPETEVGMIMYNHSLHHFGSFENIKDSLSQSFHLLRKNGVLFIREHDLTNKNISISNIYLNLQHIFLQMRYMLKSNPDTVSIRLHNFMFYYTSDFFSFKNIKSWCESIGFTFSKRVDRKTNMTNANGKIPDISHTMFLAFVKKTKTKTLKHKSKH